MTPARILLVEDDATVRNVVEILLMTEPDLELVGTTGFAEEAVGLVEREHPDLVVLDHQLEGPLTGLQVAPALKQASPALQVLLCTALDMHAEADAEPAVDGYVRKEQLVELVDVVRRMVGRA